MRVKLKYSQIIFGLILIIIICDCNGFRLFGIEDNIYKAISLMTIGVILLICILHKDILNTCKECKKFIYCYLAVLFAFLLFEYKYITYMYGSWQTLYEFANFNKHYVFILMVIPLIYIFIVNDDIKEVMDIVMILVTITLGLMLFYAFINNWQEIELFNIGMDTKTTIRNGRIRMWDLSSLEGLAIIYGAYRFLCNKRKKLLYLLQVFICIITLIYVEQTRMMLIAITISILFMIIIKPSKTTSVMLTKTAGIILTGVVGCLFVIPRLITSFSKGASISYRLIEIQFTYNLLHSQGLLGMGMISNRLQKYLFYYGAYSSISLDDIGIIGYTAQAGIWSIGLYLFPMLRMIWILLHGQKNEFQIFLWSIYIYLLVTSATLLVLDSQRILMWPFCLSMFEFYNMKYGGNKIRI